MNLYVRELKPKRQLEENGFKMIHNCIALICFFNVIPLFIQTIAKTNSSLLAIIFNAPVSWRQQDSPGSNSSAANFQKVDWYDVSLPPPLWTLLYFLRDRLLRGDVRSCCIANRCVVHRFLIFFGCSSLTFQASASTSQQRRV
ncbi:unnamed protein product [Lathyrus oleraceus]